MNARQPKRTKPPLKRKPAPDGELLSNSAPARAAVADAPTIEGEEQESSEAAAAALADLDRSGWPPHPGERRDFYHRIRMFPPEVSAWRRQMLRHLAEEPARFSHAASASREQFQAWLDDGISYLREVARILAVLYGTPDLGNKPDPTDELVYIILARQTREDAYQRAFALLKQRFAAVYTSTRERHSTIVCTSACMGTAVRTTSTRRGPVANEARWKSRSRSCNDFHVSCRHG